MNKVKCWLKWFIINPAKDLSYWVRYASPLPKWEVYKAMYIACKCQGIIENEIGQTNNKRDV